VPPSAPELHVMAEINLQPRRAHAAMTALAKPTISTDDNSTKCARFHSDIDYGLGNGLIWLVGYSF